MGTSKNFMNFVLDQINQEIGIISCKKMFGEYALYLNGIVVALVCDDKVFIKVTEGGKKFIGKPKLAPAYPGARPSFLIEDEIENSQFLTELIQITYNELLKKST